MSDWLAENDKKLKQIKGEAKDITKYEQFKFSLQEIRQDVVNQEHNLGYLKDRLSVLMEVSLESEIRKQNNDLSKLSGSLKLLIDLLSEIEQILSTVGDCVHYAQDVKNVFNELVSSSKNVHEEAEQILNTESFEEAQALLLHYQQAVFIQTVALSKIQMGA
ncbi:nesprin-1-like [Gastrophryne carolinensis]